MSGSTFDPLEDGDDRAVEPSGPPVREGLPPGFRMRADAHYVEQLDSRAAAIPVRMIETSAIEVGQHGEAPSPAFVDSVRQLGVLQPLLVASAGGRYRVISGRRRLSAARAAGVREVPCLVQHVDAERAEQMALASNLPAVRPRPAPSASPPVTHVTTELEAALSALATCAELLALGSPRAQAMAAGFIRAEAARANEMLAALKVLRDEMPMARERVSMRAVLDAVRDVSHLSCDVRVASGAADLLESVVVKGDARLLEAAMSALVGAAASLVAGGYPPAGRPDGRARDVRVDVDAAFDRARSAVTVEIVQRSIEPPAAWLARPFDIAWPIRDGGASLVRLQMARKIAHAHAGDLDLHAIPDGTAFRLTLPAAHETR